MTDAPTHLHMHRPTAELPWEGDHRPLASPEELATLMLAAYRGTPDDEGETLADTIGVLRDTRAGAFGPWNPDASFTAYDGDRPIGAVIVAEEDGAPFVPFVFRDPAYAGRGVAASLLRHACSALAGVGAPDLCLWVAAANAPAVRLYRHLGFAEVA